MSFGPAQFFGILLGPAYIAYAGAKESHKRQKTAQAEAVFEASAKNGTDEQLEREVTDLVYGALSSQHDTEASEKAALEDMWGQLERYKRDNPILCSRLAQKEKTNQFHAKFTWEDVGKRRGRLGSNNLTDDLVSKFLAIRGCVTAKEALRRASYQYAIDTK